jgi:hypothetical protein
MAAKQTITPFALRTEGLRVARKEVQALLRSKGFKISSFSYADLQRMTKSYLELHRDRPTLGTRSLRHYLNQPPNRRKVHAQGREPLRKLWRTVWSHLPQRLGPALQPKTCKDDFLAKTAKDHERMRAASEGSRRKCGVASCT